MQPRPTLASPSLECPYPAPLPTSTSAVARRAPSHAPTKLLPSSRCSRWTVPRVPRSQQGRDLHQPAPPAAFRSTSASLSEPRRALPCAPQLRRFACAEARRRASHPGLYAPPRSARRPDRSARSPRRPPGPAAGAGAPLLPSPPGCRAQNHLDAAIGPRLHRVQTQELHPFRAAGPVPRQVSRSVARRGRAPTSPSAWQ